MNAKKVETITNWFVRDLLKEVNRQRNIEGLFKTWYDGITPPVVEEDDKLDYEIVYEAILINLNEKLNQTNDFFHQQLL